MVMSCFLGVLSLLLAVSEEAKFYVWWAFPGELFPAGKQLSREKHQVSF